MTCVFKCAFLYVLVQQLVQQSGSLISNQVTSLLLLSLSEKLSRHRWGEQWSPSQLNICVVSLVRMRDGLATPLTHRVEIVVQR